MEQPCKGEPGALLPGCSRGEYPAEAARDSLHFLPAADELMTWEPFARVVHKADRFEMPEDRRRLGAGEPAALSREGNSFLEQVEASGVFQAGLMCVVDVLPSSGHGQGFAVGNSVLPASRLLCKMGDLHPILGTPRGISDEKLFVWKIKLLFC